MSTPAIEDAGPEQTAPPVVIVIGASAGGIPALRPLLKKLPRDVSVTYLLMQHTDPSRMHELRKVLATDCPLEIVIPRDGEVLQNSRVYLIPTDQDCEFSAGRVRLLKTTAMSGTRHAIDHAMVSLADRYKEHAIGIVLSGSGIDGREGMRTIKAAGGITLVQDPASAEYPSMPEAVIDAGAADLILSPVEIAAEIQRILTWRAKAPVDVAQEPLDSILRLLQRKTGFDFSQYKEGTLCRRLARRMMVNRCEQMDEYRLHLAKSEKEAAALIRDLLISVTNFFRDSKVFEALERVLRPIVEERGADEAIRIWVPGCATGEEPYSIALILAELLGDRLSRVNVQIFATDIDSPAIRTARQATYTAEAVRGVPKNLLNKYFESGDKAFRVRRELREMLVFAEHDLTQDPPFTRLDLVSCRNVLIYLKRPLQEKLLSSFHYALRPGGLLLLGNSESADRVSDLFERAAEDAKLYRRSDSPGRAPAMPYRRAVQTVAALEPQARLGMEPEVRMQHALLTAYAPPCVMLNAQQQIVYVHGKIDRYLRFPQGQLKLNPVEMAISPEIRVELRMVINKVLRDQQRADGHPIPLPESDPPRLLKVVGIPGGEGYAMVLFEETAGGSGADASADVDHSVAARILELEKELAVTREHLNANIEDLETANEELQSVNEEFQSTTEELQSTVEEYQTTNEELQSTNEERNIFNEELGAKSDALVAANADMQSILDNVAAAIIVLDGDLHIARYSAASKQLFDLWPTTIGRPFIGIGGALDLGLLTRDIHEAMRGRKPVHRELNLGEKTYEVQLMPRTKQGKEISGLILVFTDQTERADAERQSRMLATVIRDANDAVIVRDLENRIIAWNGSAQRLLGYSDKEAIGKDASDLLPAALRETAELERHHILEGEGPYIHETLWVDNDGRQIEVSVTLSVLRGRDDQPFAISAILRDIGEQKKQERRLAALIELAPDPLVLVDEHGRITRLNQQSEELFGYPRAELVGRNMRMLIPEPHRHQLGDAPWLQATDTGGPIFGLLGFHRDGSSFPVEARVSRIDVDGEVLLVASVRDVSQQEAAKIEIEQARAAAEQANLTKSRFLAAASHDLRQPLQSLSLYLASAQVEPDATRRSEVLGKMGYALDGMRSQLNILLDLSQLDSGQIIPRKRAFAIAPLLQRVCAQAQGEAEAKGLDLHCVFSSLQVYADPDLTEVMISNLTFNAVKYTRQGRVLLGCRRAGDSLRVCILDTGPGIATENQEFIFEEFAQLPGPNDIVQSGLGLGLSIVQRLAQLQNLSVSLSSKVNHGSCFAITLPIAEQSRATTAEKPTELEPTATDVVPNISLRGRVLVVDDDAAVRDASAMLLRLGGLDVDVAADAKQAEALALAHAPDLLLVDYRLRNEAAGLHLAKRLRLKLDAPDLPVFLITGDSQPDIAKLAAQARCTMLLKPVQSQDLLERIRQALIRA